MTTDAAVDLQRESAYAFAKVSEMQHPGLKRAAQKALAILYEEARRAYERGTS